MTTDDDHHEQELRRLKECIEETEEEEDKKYNQIQFNYNRFEQNDKSEDLNSNGNNEFNNEEEAFSLPDNLSLPVNLQQPSTMKEHNLIEKQLNSLVNKVVNWKFYLKQSNQIILNLIF